MPRRGDPVHYRSISGDIYDAVLTSDVSKVGFAAVEISVPGAREPVKFSRAIWRDRETDEVTACWPRGEIQGGEQK